MYADKLDGRVDDGFFERKSKEWGSEQDRVQRDIGRHHAASEAYIEDGVGVLELAARARELFIQQDPREKCRVLDSLVSSCTWANGELRFDAAQKESSRTTMMGGSAMADSLERSASRRKARDRGSLLRLPESLADR